MFQESFVRSSELSTEQRRELVKLVNAAFGRHAWLFLVERTTDEGFASETQGKELLVLREPSGPPLAMAAFEVIERTLHFGMAVVAPSMQGRGLGGQLVSVLERHATALGLEGVDLETVVEIGNEAYYRARGYVVLRTETRPAGTWGALKPFTLVHMWKELGSPAVSPRG
jgi:ribosomal protein S18 acetylase RimI-like enzyme